MIVELIASASRVFLDVIVDRKTGFEIENDLNSRFRGNNWELTNFKGEPVELTVESIVVRPKYFPEEVSNGISKAEMDIGFTEYEKERAKPNAAERINAVFKNQWMTVVRLNIRGGDAGDIRPEGLNFGFATMRSPIVSDNDDIQIYHRQVRVAETHDLQSDKLEMKILFDGSVGEYTQHISNAIDVVKHIQENMDWHALVYLFEFHHSGKREQDSSSEWVPSERALKVGEYLVGRPIEPDQLKTFVQNMKAEVEEGISEGEV